MPTSSFAVYLAGLEPESLAAIFRARPDVLLTPSPRGFEQVAQRLCDARSLTFALVRINRDALRVGTAAAMLSGPPTPARLATLLNAAPDRVDAVISDLCARGLAWLSPLDGPGPDSMRSDSPSLSPSGAGPSPRGAGPGGGSDPGAMILELPEALREHWLEPVEGRRTAAQIGRNALAEDVRNAVTALGGDTAGLRKPELIAALTERLSDPRRVASIIARLPAGARTMLDDLRAFTLGAMFHGALWIDTAQQTAPRERRALIDAGLLIPVNGRPELPREVAVAAWIAEEELGLSGPPDIPRPTVDPAGLRSAAQAAAQEAVRAVTTLVDEASAAPIAGLKRGGIGGRERVRLAKRLAMPADELFLWIDLAAAAGLLAPARRGDTISYGPGPRLDGWREEAPAQQWAALALGWFTLQHVSSRRALDEEREVPPPLPVNSAAGMIRRALLRAAAGGRSVRRSGENVEWYFPLHDYEEEECEDLVAASIQEAERLGVVAVDVLSGLGERLLAQADAMAELADIPRLLDAHDADDDGGAVPAALLEAMVRLGDQCAELLPATRTSLILQSDLTAVVSGSPTPSMARVLRAAAESESRGAAGTWRFTPTSVRAALDLGWSADELLTELRALTDRALPQALEYLIGDVARRHGHVRVRGMRSAILGDPPTVTELLHTRVLKNLHLAQLAPTVLSSPEESATVLRELRRAGFSPMPEDATGTIILPSGANPLGPPSAAFASEDDDQPSASTGRRSSRLSGGGSSARAGSGSPSRTSPAKLRRVTPEELVALLQADEHAGIPAILSPLAVTLGKMATALNDNELTLLAEAVESHGDVVIAYTDKRGSRSLRRIRINALFGRWLDAHCYLRNAGREFAIANITAVSPAG
ncbi:conserved hypothetical protein [Frankia canadensis]|uniref:Helicase XPB/Ssl2 N-terminal domain-containing protein n=1 Tax=Frankia canadensis TaxID=1836972 RepID=A0A2I2KZS3_9ACTN|nr:helicase-associated domain-containing protein [Frankia canadensis]SNQ51166.1 conserved hypothetical protein [Frankia canadensis]SOU58456.1 conserved hypothetical protein [Frankia canadensis]